MKTQAQYWRTLLFIPQYAFHKAPKIGADCYIADIQDSVPLHLKESARQGIAQACLAGSFNNQNLIVRINELAERDELQKDIETLVGIPSITGFLITMIETAEEVNRLSEMVAEEERRKGIPRGTYRFMVLVETPSAIFNAHKIAGAGMGRNLGMMFGAGDLFRLTNAEQIHDYTLDYPRNDIIYACRTAGIEPFDTPYTDIQDKTGLEWSCITAVKHGFTGKACIHSDHVDTIRRIFTPSPKKVEFARRILMSQQEGALTILQRKTFNLWNGGRGDPRSTDGMGVIDGKLIGPPHIKDSMRLLTKAKVLVPHPKSGLHGRVIHHASHHELRVGEVLPNPYEMTITEPMITLWNTAFYSHDRANTSAPYAQALGRCTDGRWPVPFMMGLYLTVSMSDTHQAIYHLGFRDAHQIAPITSGMTVRQKITVEEIKNTSDGKHSVITTRRELLEIEQEKVLFSVKKLELYPRQEGNDPSASSISGSTPKPASGDGTDFQREIVSRLHQARLVPDKHHVHKLKPHDLLLHTFARPIGIDTNLALSTYFKVTHPIHLDHHTYDQGNGRGIIVSGGLVLALTLAASSRDLYEVVWEDLIQADNIATVGPLDTVGALSYILDKETFHDPVPYEKLLIRTLGVKDLSPSFDCVGLDFPKELFESRHHRPSDYQAILKEAGAYWLEGHLATVITRQVIRLIPHH